MPLIFQVSLHGNFVADMAHLGFFHIAKTLEIKAKVYTWRFFPAKAYFNA